MVTGTIDIARYVRTAQTPPSKVTSTPADVSPVADADTGTMKQGIPVSSLTKIDMSVVKAISVKDNPELRDQMATMWLQMQAAASASEVPDNAPQNIYATVKVNGQVVATLYNGGSVAMTNEAAARAGNLDYLGPSGGPDLAQFRADTIAKAVGGTVEKASSAITQSQWTPRQSVSRNYTREQLDNAFQAMMAEGQKASAQRLASYATPNELSGSYADLCA